MKYDDASWHYGGDFPTDLCSEAGATHIGMFLAWAITRNLTGDLHREESRDSVERLEKRQITEAQFLVTECDEKFTDEDLNEIGNAFSRDYYDQSYLNDYCRVFQEAETPYRVQDTWENFDRSAPVSDQRFQTWQQEQHR